MNAPDALDAQKRYARCLTWATRVVAALLVIAFGLYAGGVMPGFVPIERLPALWNLPAAEFLRQAHVPPGLPGWAAHLGHGDMLVLALLGLLGSLSVLCLVAAMPVFLMRGERAFFMACVMQVGVLAVAISGLVLR